MKRLIGLTVLSGILALGSAAASATDSISLPTNNGIQITKSVAYPSFGKLQGANHYFDLSVQGQALDQLVIAVPDGISSIDDIEVRDQFGNRIATTASIGKEQATVNFAQPIAESTTLSVKLKDVEIDQWNNIWLYRLSGRLVIPSVETIPIGTVRIHTDAN